MNRMWLVSMGFVCALSMSAYAQGANEGDEAAGAGISSTFNPMSSTAPIVGVEGNGYKVGEGTALYPIVGVSTGAISNVFYENTDAIPSGVLRLLAQFGAGSLSSVRLSPNTPAGFDGGTNLGSFQYRAGLRLAYDFMLSGNDAVTSQGGLGLGATFRGLVNPNGPFSFGFDENFTRLIRAANFETDADTNRNINTLGLNLIYHPPARSVGGYLYYRNTIDIFDDSAIDFANRIQHRFGVHPTWRVLPKSVLYADVSIGVFSGLGSDTAKVSSFPLVAQAGFGTLLTPKITANIHAGYTNGFYASGPSFSSVTAGAQLGYRFSPLGRVALTYDLVYEDSVNANYYRDHVVRLAFQQQFVPFLVSVQPELHFRQYNGITVVMGPPTRDDVIFATSANLRYNFRNNLGATLEYQFSTVATDYRYTVDAMVQDPSFMRHQLMLGAQWAL